MHSLIQPFSSLSIPSPPPPPSTDTSTPQLHHVLFLLASVLLPTLLLAQALHSLQHAVSSAIALALLLTVNDPSELDRRSQNDSMF